MRLPKVDGKVPSWPLGSQATVKFKIDSDFLEANAKNVKEHSIFRTPPTLVPNTDESESG